MSEIDQKVSNKEKFNYLLSTIPVFNIIIFKFWDFKKDEIVKKIFKQSVALFLLFLILNIVFFKIKFLVVIFNFSYLFLFIFLCYNSYMWKYFEIKIIEKIIWFYENFTK